jgi:hypothetical protein
LKEFPTAYKVFDDKSVISQYSLGGVSKCTKYGSHSKLPAGPLNVIYKSTSALYSKFKALENDTVINLSREPASGQDIATLAG